jgi:hypothetical protein
MLSSYKKHPRNAGYTFNTFIKVTTSLAVVTNNHRKKAERYEYTNTFVLLREKRRVSHFSGDKETLSRVYLVGRPVPHHATEQKVTYCAVAT